MISEDNIRYQYAIRSKLVRDKDYAQHEFEAVNILSCYNGHIRQFFACFPDRLLKLKIKSNIMIKLK